MSVVALALYLTGLALVFGVALLTLVAAVRIRLVEAPHRLSTHGAAYRSYAARTGRSLPLLGRLAFSDDVKERR
jgi:protein-S-isoprenylcysteine O-methyltransferase Ste14